MGARAGDIVPEKKRKKEKEENQSGSKVETLAMRYQRRALGVTHEAGVDELALDDGAIGLDLAARDKVADDPQSAP